MTYRPVALAAIAALAPLICQATPERTALNSCAKAFAKSLAAEGASAPAFKIDYRGNLQNASMVQFYTRAFNFDLSARDPKTGLALARASCATNINGAVIDLSVLPLQKPSLTAAR